MDNKMVMRLQAKELRKTLPLSEISQKIVKKIKEDEIFRRAKNVMLYYPTMYEIDLLDLLEQDKSFYLPRVKDQRIEVCPYKKNDILKISKFNIFEPVSQAVFPDVLDLVIVPALMADKNGYRLGYGGGFYDRFLANCNVKTICAVANQLFVEKLPTNKFDVAVDKVYCA